MCGIAGYVGPGDRALLERMAQALRHRGPDDEGYWVGPGAGLGMRRLAIIDLPGGRQPMSNEDGSLNLVFNGEIYNFRELRSDLAQRGHRFRTRSDTEVILHAYETFGEACVDRLRGMFAFALWDAPRAMDWTAFHHSLAFGYPPAARSIFAEIAKLPPAHTATLQGGALTLRRYWSPPRGTPGTGRRPDPREAAARVRQALREAVRLRLGGG